MAPRAECASEAWCVPLRSMSTSLSILCVYLRHFHFWFSQGTVARLDGQIAPSNEWTMIYAAMVVVSRLSPPVSSFTNLTTHRR